MTYNAVNLALFPTFEKVNNFLSDILPRLTFSGLTVEYDPASMQATEDGYAAVEIEVYDLNEKVFAISAGCVFSYTAMADLAKTLELRQVELQLNALLPRMAAVGWTLKSSDPADPFLGNIGSPSQKLTLVYSDGTEQDFRPSYAALQELREELTRVEAVQYVQSHWLELEAAGCEITLGADVIIVRQDGSSKMYGHTLAEAKDLVKTALLAKKPLDPTPII